MRVADFLSDLGAYLLAVFIQGWAWVSSLFEVLGIVALLRPGLWGVIEARGVVQPLGGAIFLLSFLLANFFTYRRQRRQIRSLERDIEQQGIGEADIYLRDDYDTETSWPSPTRIDGRRPFPQVKMIRGGYREDGVPAWVSMTVRLDAENLGREDGFLVCTFDRSASRFPAVFDADFSVVPDSDSLFLDSNHRDRISRRDDVCRYFHLAVLVSEQDPRAFAQQLASLEDYCVRLIYYSHPKVGDNIRGPRYLEVKGDFHDFKQETLARWRRHGKFKYLADVADNAGESTSLETE